MPRALESVRRSVLLVVDEGPTGVSLLGALEAATIDAEWARTVAELRARTANGERPEPDVVFLDLELAGAPPDELVPLVRESFPHAAVVALAGELTGEGAARLLCQGVPSLTKPVSPLALAGLALRLTMDSRLPSSWRMGAPPPSAPRGAHLESVFSSYSVNRVLSKQQRMILRMYLDGMNDKEIAQACSCSEATVYEHWRRMARKAGGSHKGDVIADFHRFLGTD
jgi:DNA-binding NarL/FixJ family response regulator